MPPQRRGHALVAARAAARPRLVLHTDDLQHTTVVRYQHMLAQFNLLLSWHTDTTLDGLIQEHALGALQVWVMLLMQIHFDCGTAGLAEIGNLLSAISRQLRLAVWGGAAVPVPVDTTMKPLWKAFANWKKVEPYEYRFPLPRKIIHALMGVCVEQRRWLLLLFICLSFHCWLRPAECMSLTWQDICMDASLEVPGVVRISNPKIKAPATQHVIIESPVVARIASAIKAVYCRSSNSSVFPFTEFTLHREWSVILRTLHLYAVISDPKLLSARITPSGLRSSGATLDFLLHENLSRVKWRGRWANDTVLKHYLQLGVYHLAGLHFSDACQRAVALYGNMYDKWVDFI